MAGFAQQFATMGRTVIGTDGGEAADPATQAIPASSGFALAGSGKAPRSKPSPP